MKLELKRETFESSSYMLKFRDRKFLLVVNVILQAKIIILMIGLLLTYMDRNEINEIVVDYEPQVTFGAATVPAETEFDWNRLYLDISGLLLLLLLILLLALWNPSSLSNARQPKKISPWGKESILNEDECGFWYFGPMKHNID